MIKQRLDELRRVLKELEQDATLRDPARYVDRAEAMEFVEFEFHGGLADETGRGVKPLRDRSYELYGELDRVDDALYAELREQIRSGRWEPGALRDRLRKISDESEARRPGDFYGHADFFVNALLGYTPRDLARVSEEVERSGVAPDEERVFYQATPVCQVLELVDRARIGPEDVVFDLGAGIGKVAILVRLLTGARVVGVEIEPAYSRYARERIGALEVKGVEVRTEDAMAARYEEATVVFMYHPFTGRLFERVLGRLEQEAARRPMRIGTLGRCSFTVAEQEWVRPMDEVPVEEHRVAVFRTKDPA